MDYIKDFVTEDSVVLPIDGRKFKYKPASGGDENDWLNEVMYIDVETNKPMTDWAKYNKCKLRNILEVPYGKDIIKKVLKLDEEKEWKDLNEEERYNFLKKLKPTMWDKLLKKMGSYDEPEEEPKKNLSA